MSETCPTCNGRKVLTGLGTGPGGTKVLQMRCPTCNGAGEISLEASAQVKRGRELREARLARGMGLRKEARRRCMSPSDLSAMEQGAVAPVFDEPQQKETQ